MSTRSPAPSREPRTVVLGQLPSCRPHTYTVRQDWPAARAGVRISTASWRTPRAARVSMGRSCASMKSRNCSAPAPRICSSNRLAASKSPIMASRLRWAASVSGPAPRVWATQVFSRPLASQRAQSTSVLVESGRARALRPAESTAAMRCTARPTPSAGRVSGCSRAPSSRSSLGRWPPVCSSTERSCWRSRRTSMLDAPPSREVSRVMALFAPLRGLERFSSAMTSSRLLRMISSASSGLRAS